RLVASDAAYHLTALEQNQSRDTQHAIVHEDILIGIGVELGDAQFAIVLIGKLLDNGCNHLARAAPLCPEINQYRGIRTEDFLIEILGGRFECFASHECSLRTLTPSLLHDMIDSTRKTKCAPSNYDLL